MVGRSSSTSPARRSYQSALVHILPTHPKLALVRAEVITTGLSHG